MLLMRRPVLVYSFGVFYAIAAVTLLVQRLWLNMFPKESTWSFDCGKPLPHGFSPGNTTTVEILATNDQPVRQYNVHLPVDYQNNRGHAIVFSFHGRTRDMFIQEDLSQLSQEGLLINGAGIIAVYPQGVNGTNGGTAWQGAPYSAPDVNDVRVLFNSFSISIDNGLMIIDSLCKHNDR